MAPLPHRNSAICLVPKSPHGIWQIWLPWLIGVLVEIPHTSTAANTASITASDHVLPTPSTG